MPRPTRHILLIDDSFDDRADLRQMLLRAGNCRYRFSEAELGAEGVCQVLTQAPGTFDCVLLDHVLPDMDAPEVLAALCKGTSMAPCPVVVITGAAAQDGLRLLGAGAQDYIGKQWTSPDSLTRGRQCHRAFCDDGGTPALRAGAAHNGRTLPGPVQLDRCRLRGHRDDV